MKQAHVFISGAVHGVGFRFFIKSWARQFGIAGWVGNTADGRVEGIFQGEENSVADLITKCRKGPFLAEVKDVDVQWEEIDEKLSDFQVR